MEPDKIQAQRTKIEAGQQWVETNIKKMASSFNLKIAEMSWQSINEYNGTVYTCSVQSYGKRAAKMFTTQELETCPFDTQLQQTLISRLSGLLRYLAF